MTRVAAPIVGLFPPIHPGLVGGVQASGRLAWSAVEAECGSAGATPGSRPRLIVWPGRGVSIWARARTVAGALAARRPGAVVLVWHLSLLRLVPILRAPAARLVVFLHGIEAWRRHDLVTRRLLGRVDLFLSNSDHTWRRFLAHVPGVAGRPHRTVYLGIGAPLDGPSPEPDPTPAAAVVSRLRRDEGYKGHRELIDAWPLVLRERPDAELWIVGDGDLRRDLAAHAVRLGLEGRVRFWGGVQDTGRDRLLARARCLALPSRGEGFGLVYAEAMRLGRPCLVSPFDAGAEVVNPPEAGLSVDPREPGELAATLGRLLAGGPEWRRWSAHARRRYEERFTARHFAERLVGALSPAGARAEAREPA
jgi:phosphatidylinositol alpha-1,6-mannosyltransferase